jgi:hypothetical protein
MNFLNIQTDIFSFFVVLQFCIWALLSCSNGEKLQFLKNEISFYQCFIFLLKLSIFVDSTKTVIF